MPTDVTTTLRKALTELEGERKRIDQQIEVIEGALATLGGRSRRGRTQTAKARKTVTRSMSPAARKAVSRRMKAYWAKRKAEATKGKAKAEK